MAENGKIFEETNLEQTQANQAAQNNQEGNTTYLEQLVGEGKKFKNSEDLAKGKNESDIMITDLLTQLEESKQELNKRLTLEEFMTKMDNRTPVTENILQQQSGGEIENGEQKNSPNTTTEDDINAMLDKRLGAIRKEDIAESNVNSAVAKMNEMWGADANLRLNEKAREIGVSITELQEYAKTNPKVFYNLIGATGAQQNNNASVLGQTTVNTSTDTSKISVGDTNAKNYAYFEKIRQTDKAEYRRLQPLMHKMAVELGDNFYT